MATPTTDQKDPFFLGALRSTANETSGDRLLPALPVPSLPHSDLGLASERRSASTPDLFFNPWRQSPALHAVPEYSGNNDNVRSTASPISDTQQRPPSSSQILSWEYDPLYPWFLEATTTGMWDSPSTPPPTVVRSSSLTFDRTSQPRWMAASPHRASMSRRFSNAFQPLPSSSPRFSRISSSPTSIIYTTPDGPSLSEVVATRTMAFHLEATTRRVWSSAFPSSSAVVPSSSLSLDQISPARSIATSMSRASEARRFSLDLYARPQPQDITAPSHRISSHHSLQLFERDLNSLGSANATHIKAPDLPEWFVDSVGRLCAAVSHTFEETQLIQIPLLVGPHIRVICDILRCRLEAAYRSPVPPRLRLLPWLCFNAPADIEESIYRAVSEVLCSMLMIEDGVSILIRAASLSPPYVDVDGDLRSLMSIEVETVSISTVAKFLRSIPSEVKTWRTVPQLVFQLLQVIKRLSTQYSLYSNQLAVLRTSICSCVLILLTSSRSEEGDTWYIDELIYRGTQLVQELSYLNICLRLWEAVPNGQLLDELKLADGLATFAEHMSQLSSDLEPTGNNIRLTGDNNSPQYVDMADEIRAFFSRTTDESDHFGRRYGGEGPTRRRLTGTNSVATSGTHFDPNNPIHQLAKETFMRFEEDVSSVYTYHSHIP